MALQMLKFVLLSRNTRTWVIYLNVDSLKAGTMSVLFTVASQHLIRCLAQLTHFKKYLLKKM